MKAAQSARGASTGMRRKVAYLEKENARLARDLAEGLARETATGEILRVIAGSATDLQPVLDVIAVRATALCDGVSGAILLYDGEQLSIGALHAWSAEAGEALQRAFPRRPTRDFVSGQAILN